MKISTLATILAAGTAVNAVPVQQVNHEARQVADVLQGLIDKAGKLNPTQDASADSTAATKDEVLDNGLDKLKKRAEGDTSDDAETGAFDEGGRLDQALEQLRRGLLNDYVDDLMSKAAPGNLLKRQEDLEMKINETISDAISEANDMVPDDVSMSSKRQADLPVVGPLLEQLAGGSSSSSAAPSLPLPTKRQADLPVVGPLLEQLAGGGSSATPAAPSLPLPTKRQADLPVVGPLLEQLAGGSSSTPAAPSLPLPTKRQLDSAKEMLSGMPVVGTAVEGLLGDEEESESASSMPSNPLQQVSQLGSRDVYRFWEANGDTYLADVHRVDKESAFDATNRDGHHHKETRQSEGEDAESGAEEALDGESLTGLDDGLDALKKRQLDGVTDMAKDLPIVGGLLDNSSGDSTTDTPSAAAAAAAAASSSDTSSPLDALPLKKRQLDSVKDMAEGLPVVGGMLNGTSANESDSSSPLSALPLKARQLIPSPPDLSGVLEGGSPSSNPDAKGLDKLRRLLEEEKPDPVADVFDGLQGTVKEVSDTLPGNGGTAETFFERRADDSSDSSNSIQNILKSLQSAGEMESTATATSTSAPTSTPSSSSSSTPSSTPNILDDLTNTAALKNGLSSAIDMIPE
ncbi:hypothetical protein J056_004088 [Wallemia ichthyophaga EXF-994]|uniref:Uncharacterized protein n=1 Tax=Wallemia ichthyophaga (strain EXF-994 / CBS 113033) TaxID=1299270 RepID=R9AI17_WALI9|nr:uncharacterized protein J056_004088 [Wallemia ichthyophaga EXF-994]EOR01852.1 hypothetical protein J056_004088 [Wallemia ichthyophaga EXF-994]